jgi:hypothetical protein
LGLPRFQWECGTNARAGRRLRRCALGCERGSISGRACRFVGLVLRAVDGGGAGCVAGVAIRQTGMVGRRPSSRDHLGFLRADLDRGLDPDSGARVVPRRILGGRAQGISLTVLGGATVAARRVRDPRHRCPVMGPISAGVVGWGWPFRGAGRAPAVGGEPGRVSAVVPMRVVQWARLRWACRTHQGEHKQRAGKEIQSLHRVSFRTCARGACPNPSRMVPHPLLFAPAF